MPKLSDSNYLVHVSIRHPRRLLRNGDTGLVEISARQLSHRLDSFKVTVTPRSNHLEFVNVPEEQRDGNSYTPPTETGIGGIRVGSKWRQSYRVQLRRTSHPSREQYSSVQTDVAVTTVEGLTLNDPRINCQCRVNGR